MAQPCELCSNVVSFDEDYNPDYTVRDDFFHQPCAACEQYGPCDPDLCVWCKHLRLRHLIKCLEVADMWPRPHFYLRRDLLSDTADPHCPLCRIFRHILSSMSHKISSEQLAECCLELSLDVSDGSIRGWFTSTHFDDLVGPMFYIQDSSNSNMLPLITENISWGSLQDGIQECLERHQVCRNDEHLRLPSGFRVIDLERQCISEIQADTCNFFALSYVWGEDRSPHSKITKANYDILTQPAALTNVRLPQTVQDAMTACTQLGQRYLWVDRLCIVQDSPEDKAKQISAMDRIYRSAQYVIIAYASDNMDSGMVGISRPRVQSQMRVQTGGLTLTSDAFDDFCDHTFKGCVWLERGWTYQEYELAKRKLCFRNTQAFLECRHGRKEEYRQGFGDIGDEIWTARRVDPLFGRYTTHINSYSRRRLTFPSDGVAAITGVLRWFYENKGGLFCGLPEAHFDRALLWYGVDIKLGRHTNGDFPSWSWAFIRGMCSSVRFRDATWRGHVGSSSFEFCGTLVPWYTVDTDGKVRPVNSIPDDQLRAKWKNYAAIAFEGGCVANSSEDSQYILSPAELWPDYASYVQQVIQDYPSSQIYTEFLNNICQDAQFRTRKNVLLTLAQTATVNWRLRPLEDCTSISLLAPDGNRIGETTPLLKDWVDFSQLSALWGETVELMGISLSILTAPGEEAEWPLGRFVIVKGQNFPDVPVVNVLIIERRRKFAMRRQLGWVFLQDWINLAKRWEHILLE